MQNSYSKLRDNAIIVAIIASIPLLMVGIVPILPTFDDWTTLSSPNYDNNFLKYLLPFGTTWRPGDALLGYVNAIDYRLFPAINHILIILAHATSAILVYKITGVADMDRQARNFATLFFYLSPCVCGTIMSCDALNQSYSHMWGMAAVYAYLTMGKGKKYACWVIFVFLSSLSKDNGITWAIVPPIVSFAIRRERARDMARHCAFGFAIALAYLAIRLSLPRTIIDNGSHLEQMLSIGSKIKGVATWIGYTWVAADYICLMHEPSRNIMIVGITIVASTPFIAYCFFRRPSLWKSHSALALIVAIFVTASANLLISMSVMNAYCSLGMAALLLAFLIDGNSSHKRTLNYLFALYIATAVIVDLHHWYKSWQTSLPTRTIALDIIRKTGKPVNKVYNISIHNDNDKYSSFCVPKDEAVGWGRAMLHYNAYKWPKEINDTTISASDATPYIIRHLADSALNSGYDCVWVVGGKDNLVMKRKQKKQ